MLHPGSKIAKPIPDTLTEPSKHILKLLNDTFHVLPCVIYEIVERVPEVTDSSDNGIDDSNRIWRDQNEKSNRVFQSPAMGCYVLSKDNQARMKFLEVRFSRSIHFDELGHSCNSILNAFHGTHHDISNSLNVLGVKLYSSSLLLVKFKTLKSNHLRIH